MKRETLLKPPSGLLASFGSMILQSSCLVFLSIGVVLGNPNGDLLEGLSRSKYLHGNYKYI